MQGNSKSKRNLQVSRYDFTKLGSFPAPPPSPQKHLPFTTAGCCADGGGVEVIASSSSSSISPEAQEEGEKKRDHWWSFRLLCGQVD